MKSRLPLVVLGLSQFLLVIDTSVMNVSITTLARDFNVNVTTIQLVITIYTLVMAAFMLTGGKLGDIMGRKRAYRIGHVIYGCGSLMTALAPTILVLTIGWSILEGLGACLVLPALAALVASNFTGEKRAVAYSVVGGMSGIAIGLGPVVGGWATTYLSWRYVFGAEVVVVIAILALTRYLDDSKVDEKPPRLDVGGAFLSVVGLALAVLAIQMSSSWGWIKPKTPPFTIAGFAPTLFVIAAGLLILYGFFVWTARRDGKGLGTLVRPALLKIKYLRASLVTMVGLTLTFMGVSFVLALYLQVVLGLSAFDTGIRMLPISLAMLVMTAVAPRLTKSISPRLAIRIAFGALAAGLMIMVVGMKPDAKGATFVIALVVMGAGLGILAGKANFIAQWAVEEADRSEAGGLTNTASNLGSSLGVALVGAIVIGALASFTMSSLVNDPAVDSAVTNQVGTALATNANFLSDDQVEQATTQAGLPPDQVNSIVSSYSEAQMKSLTAGLLLLAFLALGAMVAVRGLPNSPISESAKETEKVAAAP